MSRHSVLLASAVLLGTASGIAAWKLHESLASAQQRIEAADAQRVQARAALHAASDRLRDARAAQAALIASSPAPKEKSPAGVSPSERPKRDWKAEAKRFEAQAKDPNAQLQWLAILKLRLREKYDPLYRRLSLTPDKIEAFEAAEAVCEEKNRDIGVAAATEQVDNDDPVVRALYGEAARERTKQEKAILGRDAYAELNEYRRTQPARDIVAAFDGAATVSGSPLNEAQKEQLTAAVAAASPGFGNTNTPVNPMEIDWARVDAAAVAILSPAQIDLLRTEDPPNHSVGGGGRYWTALNKAMHAAQRADAAAGTVIAAGPTR